MPPKCRKPARPSSLRSKAVFRLNRCQRSVQSIRVETSVYQQRLATIKFVLVHTLFFALVCLKSFATPEPDQIIDDTPHNFGRRADQAVGDRPQLNYRFTSTTNATEVTLQISHRGVMLPWSVLVNGRRVGQTGTSYKNSGQNHVPVPAGLLVEGQNILSLVGEEYVNRSSTIEKISLFKNPIRELLKLRAVFVSVADEATGKPIPARISIINEKGASTELFYLSATNSVMRTGLIYTTGEKASFEIPEGTYQCYATRGMEWSLGRKTILLQAGEPPQVDLRIRRQVDTTGFIAADTHVHTLTFSGHGDATPEERMLTLAGEGVELAVATDHNHFTDYRPYQSRLALNAFFTSVVGDEITTKNGHLNAFPFPPNASLPDHRESDWVKIVEAARMKGAKVVILNHPRFPGEESNPMMQFDFNRASGDRFNGPVFTFDAMELVNSSQPVSMARPELVADPLRLLADWFPILNRGEKITGVGASDSHTVNNPVGQGRTYVRSSTDDAAHLDVDKLVRNFLAGDTSVSYGIFAEVTVNEVAHMGEVLRPANGKVEVNLRVASADWIKPRRAIVFLNGLPVAETKLQPIPGKAFNERLKFFIETPPHDAYLVCAVFGDGVTEPYWPTIATFTAAVTNPLYLDNDRDGLFQFPRATARKLMAATDGTLKSIWELINKSDDALAGQMLGLLSLERDPDFINQLNARLRADLHNRALYQTFLEHSPLVILPPKSSNAK
jgi:hypothetical protein